MRPNFGLVFSYKEYLTEEDSGTLTFKQAIQVLFDVSDVKTVVVDHLQVRDFVRFRGLICQRL